MKKEKTFDELYAIAKSKGLSDMEALNAANDKQVSDLYNEIFTEDAEFEVVSDKQLPNSELPLVDETNTNIPTDNRGA